MAISFFMSSAVKMSWADKKKCGLGLSFCQKLNPFEICFGSETLFEKLLKVCLSRVGPDPEKNVSCRTKFVSKHTVAGGRPNREPQQTQQPQPCLLRRLRSHSKRQRPMLGFSYGEIFLLLGVTAAVIGPKDLPIIARTAGRLAGRAIGYVQLARGQFDSVMQQTQARQVHKELQDTMAQLDAIRHEIRSISIINPGPMTRRLVDNLDQTSISNENRKPEDVGGSNSIPTVTKDSPSLASNSCDLQSQATTYARLAESPAVKNGLTGSSTEVEKIKDELQFSVLPVSAENTGLLPNRGGNVDVKGSDIVLEAILEAEVAHNAKEFFSQPQNQT